MSVLLISYTLRQPGKDYEPLWAALRKFKHCHALESAWFIDTNIGPADVRTALCKLVDQNDQIYVNRLHQHWAACRKEQCSEWLKSPERTWD